MRNLCMLFVAFCVFSSAVPISAATTSSDMVMRAEVQEIVVEGERPVAAVNGNRPFQTLTVRILEGARAGEVVQFDNDSPYMLREGQTFYLHRTETEGGGLLYAVGEPDRRIPLFLLLIGFIVTTVLVAGTAGVRSLVALAASFLLIIFGLLPLLHAGAPPALTSVALATGMLIVSMIITHGWNRPTLVALAGSIGALVVAALVAEAAVAAAHLSGFVSDETVYLNFETNGTLDLTGLLLGGILIGIVGVLNDISVSQVHTVAELTSANPTLSRRSVFSRAMKVGREHFGAVVNTLPLAYAGASLPLLLLFSTSEAPFLFIMNREVFSAELIRILAGGIALALSGAIATILAIFFIVRSGKPKNAA